MIRIALTGSIGMGKSTVARMFEAAGVPVFDADAVVRQLQGPGGALVERIGELFPGCVRSGTLDRECLAEIVLGDRAKLAALEAVVHPAVREWRQAFIDRHRDAPALLFEIPLLFETGGEYDFDKVVVVSAPGQVQRARVLERRGMTLAKLESVLARQMPDEEKRRRADFVIDTDTDLSTTEAQVRDILACLGVAAG
ncbi:dephospho-CoA kinase [Sphingomonas segetis]|jgi:dephospho-CoA kinase|uniref:dephospho-CoA kinase n=1 Tax=Sphingomonas segetis TaxID=1104779 RepID=UPI0012D2CAFC|nr:dephospho-CoA kinase [Sphingomonas segetis]